MTSSIQTWPLNIDFTSAVQNPQVCFKDPALRRSQVYKNSRGRVILWSGNFAAVYKLTDPREAETAWAVRCFTRIPQPDVQQRYAAISKHLSTYRLPYLVNFEFIPEGILIRSDWYPILKMEWVEGLELDRYIGNHLGDSQILLALNQQLRQLKQDLHATGIAHGDLQHGNIMVTPSGQLKLVDYDGMYVPALKGNPPCETGHPNYQLPERSPQDFDEEIDDFSFDVISLSLRAIAKQPELWDSFHEDNKNLIFRQDDFKEPLASPVFQSISLINDVDTQFLCTQLIEKCGGEIVTTGTSSITPLKSMGAWLKFEVLQIMQPRHHKWLAISGLILIGLCLGILLLVKNWLHQQQTVTANVPPDSQGTNSDRQPKLVPLPLARITKEELLSQYKLGKRNFGAVNLAGVSLNEVVLSGINLSGSVLTNANLQRADLSGANLSNVVLKNANLLGIDLSNTNLNDADLSNATMSEAKLIKVSLLRANLSDAKLDFAQLRGAELMRANLSGANLSLANLSASDLLLANLRKANLLKANLRESNLNGANLSEASLDSANLLLADLRSAELYLSNLSSANFSATDLSSANLVLVDLAGTNFKDANFSGANIDKVNSIQDANFSGAKNLSPIAKQYFCAIAAGTFIDTKTLTKTTLNCL